MVGLLVLLFLLAYLSVLWFVTRYAWKAGKRTGNDKAAWRYAICGAAVCLAPFADAPVKVIGHAYYCATGAQYSILKNPEQWIEENQPDRTGLFFAIGERPRLEQLVNGWFQMLLNRRVAIQEKTTPVLFGIKRRETRLIDLGNSELLFIGIDYATGKQWTVETAWPQPYLTSCLPRGSQTLPTVSALEKRVSK